MRSEKKIQKADHNDQLFTIQQLSKKLDIPKPTLRFWEKELKGVITPIRTTGGQRRYTFEHIALIKKIRGLREDGVSLTDIREILDNKLNMAGNLYGIDDAEMLTNRITEIIRFEINRYFQSKEFK